MKNAIVLYAHNGSENHGCEALVRTTADLVRLAASQYPSLVSADPQSDENYLGDMGLRVCQRGRKMTTLERVFAKLIKTVTGSVYYYDRIEMETIACKIRDSLCISIGGDNYCYEDYAYYGRMNTYLNRNGNRTVLWGCSVEPERLKDSGVLEDLRRYALITARESITYQAMLDAGLQNVRFCPDSAFLLPVQETVLPAVFQGKVVGLNLSPLVLASGNELVLENYRQLIQFILTSSDMSIALIPHVTTRYSNDLEPLHHLLEAYEDTGRVVLMDQDRSLNACQLKYVISKCSYLVTARTHASIAGYSTGVPTLVVGYSVKARGLAQDIFGGQTPYVCGAGDFQSAVDLKNAFCALMEQREHIIQAEKAYCAQADPYFSAICQWITENQM